MFTSSLVWALFPFESNVYRSKRTTLQGCKMLHNNYILRTKISAESQSIFVPNHHNSYSVLNEVQVYPYRYFGGSIPLVFAQYRHGRATLYWKRYRNECNERVFSSVPFTSADLETDDPKGPIVIDSDETGLCNDSDSRPSSVEPSAKTIRTGKQYKCPHCSYSADKKVSASF